ncbi:hypothetical protein M1N66_01695, partial [Thermodesulfovibrionales bacterium]|nr:hypothetical protein [Thermodesulfovibrionales bacterium]MCL0096305.1 hypothetical protein [Thermodesulfovibrionales bacterium]
FLPEPVLSINTKIPRFARNDKSEGVGMTKWLVAVISKHEILRNLQTVKFCKSLRFKYNA